MKTFYIYTLINPINEEIFYVGCCENPKRRAIAHKYFNRKIRKGGRLTEPHVTYKRVENYVIINKIVPILQVVRTVVCETRFDAEVIEAQMINKLFAEGHPLTNRNKDRKLKVA